MHFEEALFGHLKECKELSNLIGAKIYPLVIPQGVQLPAVVYQKISQSRHHTLQGDSGATVASFQITCYAKRYLEVKTVAEKIRLALQNFTGTMGGVGGLHVQSTTLQSEIDVYDEEANDYCIHMDFEFFYIEKVN